MRPGFSNEKQECSAVMMGNGSGLVRKVSKGRQGSDDEYWLEAVRQVSEEGQGQ